jgi:microcystin-dependent protein
MVSASDTDTDFTVGKTGGEKTHTLTVDELASHSHDISVAEGTDSSYDNKVKAGRRNDSFVAIAQTKSTGGNRPHNNLQPYVAVYIWRRIR